MNPLKRFYHYKKLLQKKKVSNGLLSIEFALEFQINTPDSSTQIPNFDIIS